MEQQYKIVLKFKDFGFEVESTDKKWVEDKEKEYLEKFYSSESAKEKCIKSEVSSLPKEALMNLSINEFYKKYVKASNTTSRPDMAVFFVYFLQKIQKLVEIKSGNVTECFKNISYPSYNTINYTDILNQGKRKGFLNCVNKNWSLTLTGEDFIMGALSTASEK